MRTAPAEHPGRLFVDARARPIEADEVAVGDGTAIAMTIRGFSSIPVLG